MYDSKLERDFHKRWKKATKVPLVTQHKFHPTRQWRFDFAHLPTLTAIEIQGYGEGHTSYEGMAADYEKHNEAIRHGWIILYIMSVHTTERNIGKTVKFILSIIDDRPKTVQKQLRPTTPRSLYEETIQKLLEDI